MMTILLGISCNSDNASITSDAVVSADASRAVDPTPTYAQEIPEVRLTMHAG